MNSYIVKIKPDEGKASSGFYFCIQLFMMHLLFDERAFLTSETSYTAMKAFAQLKLSSIRVITLKAIPTIERSVNLSPICLYHIKICTV